MANYFIIRIPLWLIALGFLFVPNISVGTQILDLDLFGIFIIAIILGDTIGYYRKEKEIRKSRDNH